MNPTYRVEDGVAHVDLDDGKANVMRTDSLAELRAMIGRAADDGAEVLVVSGRPGMFSGGLDVKWLATCTADDLTDLVDTFAGTMLDLLTSTVPTVAAVTGHAIAGGAVMAMACDRRIGVGGQHRLQMNEVAIGIPVPSWMEVIARSAIPTPHLFDVLQLAQPLSFDTAARLGTLHTLVDADGLEPAVTAAVAELRALDSEAFAATKAMLWSAAADAARRDLAGP